eukprot:Blabericola_migrator_1__12577@NODE_7_length_25668_cov_124_338502_g6_i0_p7_GENE_NODE_7_length_25668_cov_124_338502_g6_i0NODE_7_length_25668_cov_124_338502_g6_i0_p7_ORF_typecomplete_len439_score70_42PIGX/PF08320_12/1_2e07_NODE_7_length_25668_cov_124_338502_g6_i02187023186
MLILFCLILSVDAVLKCVTDKDTGYTTTSTGGGSIPYTYLESKSPFYFEVNQDRVTLLAPASQAAINKIQQIAPSQFQANWKRTGGVIEGGDNVNAWVYELLPSWLNLTMPLPPIPLYIETKYLLEQNQLHLPAYFGTFSIRDLTSMKIPLFEVFTVMAQDLFPLHSITDAAALVQDYMTAVVTREVPDMREALEARGVKVVSVGLEYTGVSPSGVLKVKYQLTKETQGTLCDVTEPTFYDAIVTQRDVVSTGLTHDLKTVIEVSQAVEEDCEVTLHEFWPPFTFVDGEELLTVHNCVDDTAATHPSQIIFPHFSEIELPAHLAAPTMLMVKWKGPLLANQPLTTCPLHIHTRYNLPVTRQYPTSLELPNPVVTVKCFGLVNVVQPELAPDVFAPIIDLITVTRRDLGLISRITTVFSAVAVISTSFLMYKSVFKPEP